MSRASDLAAWEAFVDEVQHDGDARMMSLDDMRLAWRLGAAVVGVLRPAWSEDIASAILTHVDDERGEP